MKTAIYKKEDRTCLYLLIGFVVLTILYLVSMYLWLKGVWGVKVTDVTVGSGINGAIHIRVGYLMFKWARRNIFSIDKG